MSGRKPPLHGVHDERGARMTEFGGWEMPVDFDSIRTEHEAVREQVGKFDVSHMGRIEVGGPDAATLCQRLTSNDVEALDAGEAQYAMITDESGTIIDDTVIYRLPDRPDRFLFVPNAGNDDAMRSRWVDHRDTWDLTATVDNRTLETGMIAVQGPNSSGLLSDVASGTPDDLEFFHAGRAEIDGVDCLVSRTGYTGEDGFEIICNREGLEAVWQALECQPCGLGARDTLRMEYGFLLAGQDFDREDNPRNPYEARAEFTVELDTEFVGRDALAAVAEAGPDELFVGLILEERGIPRHGYSINRDGERIGLVTSGTMSPTLGEPIGLGYVPTGLADPGTEVTVSIRGDEKMARIESPRFLA